MNIEKVAFGQWTAFCNHVRARRDIVSPFRELFNAYCEPHRRYHTISHILNCLCELKFVDADEFTKTKVEFALWFHDFVYDPFANDNEERSAAKAREFASKCMLPDMLSVSVERLILATKHVQTPKTFDEQLIVDIDLSILGNVPAIFDKYERDIEIEYQAVPAEEYRKGRIDVLNGFLQRSHIYMLDAFVQKYEESARLNISRSLALLSEKIC